MTLAKKIFELLETHSDEEARAALSEVVREFDLDVAANLIAQNVEPHGLKKWSLEDDFYSEGNEQAGHFPLQRILEVFQEVINSDTSETKKIVLEKHPVRRYTEDELTEEGKDADIVWHKLDQSIDLEKLNIGFEAV